MLLKISNRCFRASTAAKLSINGVNLRQWFNILLNFVKYFWIKKKKKRQKKLEFLFLKMSYHKILRSGPAPQWTVLGTALSMFYPNCSIDQRFRVYGHYSPPKRYWLLFYCNCENLSIFLEFWQKRCWQRANDILFSLSAFSFTATNCFTKHLHIHSLHAPWSSDSVTGER